MSVEQGRAQPRQELTWAMPVHHHGGRATNFATEVLLDSLPDNDIGTSHDADPQGIVIGTILKDRFVIKERIGHGGMGVVFAAADRRKIEARDPNPLVAVKVIDARLASHPDALIALQREARKAQTLAHPNVTTVFDFDRAGDTVFMTMELLRGRSLDKVLEEQTNGVGREKALSIIRDVAQGLAYAHRNGIVHSDLKPGNIFLCEDDTAKLLDFGIARAVPPANVAVAGSEDSFNPRSLCAYTEAYATVEMLSGGAPCPQDDVYALGLIAYQLFTGQHPFEFCSALKARESEFKPPAPRAMRWREWRVVRRSLSFDPDWRPRDASQFIAQFASSAFAGSTHQRNALIAAAASLGLIASYGMHQRNASLGPAMQFVQLPAGAQEQFRQLMNEGDDLWRFYVQDRNILALQEAVEQYNGAYELHPGNRQAVQRLERAAKAALQTTQEHPQQRREFARALVQRSAYLATFPPLAAGADEQ